MFTLIVGRSNSAVLVELYAVRSTIEIAFPSVCLSVSVSVRELCPNGGFLLVSVCGRPLTWICCKKRWRNYSQRFIHGIAIHKWV